MTVAQSSFHISGVRGGGSYGVIGMRRRIRREVTGGGGAWPSGEDLGSWKRLRTLSQRRFRG